MNFWMRQQQSAIKESNKSTTPVFSNPQQAKELSQTLGIETPPAPRIVATASDIDTLRKLLSVDDINPPTPPRRVAFPGSSLGVPTAYGAKWGDYWLGGAFGSNRLYPSDNPEDGSLALGVGFGDPKDLVGLEVSLGIFNVQADPAVPNDSFGNGSAIGFKLHRYLDEQGYFAAAIGMTNAIHWGSVQQQNAIGGYYPSYFGVLTKRFDLRPVPDFSEADFSDPSKKREAIDIYNQLQNGSYNFMPLTVSVGVGTGEFRSIGALDASEQNVNVFGSAGLTIIPQVSLISTWTGSQLIMGASIAPFENIPIVLNLAAGDVTGNYPEGTRFVMSLGLGSQF
ncbi:MAG: hypothetical protein ACRC6M_17390 [Microcystaceae cyanobacterium]